MPIVRGECVKAEFETRFKNSGALVQKTFLFLLKMLLYPRALTFDYRTIKPVTVINNYIF